MPYRLLAAPSAIFVIALLAAAGCGSNPPHDSGSSPPGAPPPSSSPPRVPPPPPPTVRDDAPRCAGDADCKGGTVCFYDLAGCDASAQSGRCHEPSWTHECAANVPVCGCDGRTLWGNNCSDVIRERWAARGACACQADTDCRGGQACFFGTKGCDAAGQCEDPTRRRCSQRNQTLCSCKGKTLSDTCTREVREPWAQLGPCDAAPK